VLLTLLISAAMSLADHSLVTALAAGHAGNPTNGEANDGQMEAIAEWLRHK